ncbi:MAG: OmpA family protein [Myxococcales bacterium]|nr:OmpA family protein [Myxococcales bacterium]
MSLLAASAGVAGCGHSEAEWQGKLREISTLQGQVRDLTGERDRLSEQLTALQASNEAMARRLSELGENVSRLQQEGARTQNELTAAQQREAELRRRQQQQEARLSTYRNMLSQFQSMISAGQLRVRVVRGRMVVELPAGILFDSGRAELRAEGQNVLRQVAQVLAGIRDRDFLVAGHTDNAQLGRGARFADNWELSAARATNVVRFLAQNNVTAEHLGAAGYAEYQPATPNDTDEHRALNRRVEIVLLPNIEELPDLSTLDGGQTPGSTAPPAPSH